VKTIMNKTKAIKPKKRICKLRGLDLILVPNAIATKIIAIKIVKTVYIPPTHLLILGLLIIVFAEILSSFLGHEINEPNKPYKPNSLFPIYINESIYSLKSHESKKSQHPIFSHHNITFLISELKSLCETLCGRWDLNPSRINFSFWFLI